MTLKALVNCMYISRISVLSISDRKFNRTFLHVMDLYFKAYVSASCTFHFALTLLHFFCYFTFLIPSHNVHLWRFDDLFAGCVASSLSLLMVF